MFSAPIKTALLTTAAVAAMAICVQGPASPAHAMQMKMNAPKVNIPKPRIRVVKPKVRVRVNTKHMAKQKETTEVKTSGTNPAGTKKVSERKEPAHSKSVPLAMVPLPNRKPSFQSGTQLNVPKGIADLIGTLGSNPAAWRDLERFADLRTFREGNRALNENEIGGGRRDQDNGTTVDPWDRFGLNRPGGNEREPEGSKDGGSWPRFMGPSSAGSNPLGHEPATPGVLGGRNPGGAGAGLKGRGGETSQDNNDGPVFTRDEDGGVTEADTITNPDGSSVTFVLHYKSEKDRLNIVKPEWSYVMFIEPAAPDDSDSGDNMTFTLEEAEASPERQPDPSESPVGYMPCFTGNEFGCRTAMPSLFDALSQPGFGGAGDEDIEPWSASIAERKQVVTNPDPEGQLRSGGGGGGMYDPKDPCKPGPGC